MSKNTDIQKIVILGAGESGAGTAVLAKQKGFDVFVSDFGTIKIRFFTSYKIRMDIKEVNSIKRALKLGKILAEGLDVKLLNATEQPPIFVE